VGVFLFHLLPLILVMGIPASLCVKCKGRLWCKLPSCPIIESFEQKQTQIKSIKGNEFSGTSPPSVFVSWGGYPNVTIAPVSPATFEKDADLLDNPERWYGIPEQEIVNMRSSLIQSRKPISINAARDPHYELQDMQELVMSKKPVASEFQLTKSPTANLSFSGTSAPFGPRGKLRNFSLTENPKIPKKVDYFYSDTAAKSMDALTTLHKKFPVHYLHKMLSSGVFGVQKNRKLVPTRWSITAVDSNVSKFLIDEKVKYYEEVGQYTVFQSHYLDNHFFVLLIPRPWSFEMMETWMPGGGWAAFAEKGELNIVQDHELYEGRKKYADNITGAYYAARLAIAEYLCKKKRQAAAIVFREIGQGYTSPLGVWQVRENVRHALQEKPISFSDMGLALQYIDSKTTIPMETYKKTSKLIPEIKNQRRLKEWF
jgi:DNA repair protein NreA